MQPFGERGEETTLAQVEQALSAPRTPPAAILERIRGFAARDAGDLEPELRRRAALRRDGAGVDLAERGEREAADLRDLLQRTRDGIVAEQAKPEDSQLSLFRDDEAEQRQRDRREWSRKLASLDAQLASEPDRVRESYAIRADRVEIVGLLYLWPGTN